jgi:DNA polymerase-1
LNKADKILSTFIPALEKAIPRGNWHYLHGNFNMGGTLSARMSSNSPNLQNLPSGSTYGKLIKSCFKAKPGWIMVGADFNALEARIDALVTKDPAKLGVYIYGYDSHAYNAYYYWKHKFPEIVLADEGEKVYNLTVNGEPVFMKGTDLLQVNETTQITVEDYFNATYPKL